MKITRLVISLTITASLAIFVFSSSASAAVPTVASMSPAGGRLSGDTSVTVTGTNFESGATVTIGGNSATDVVVVSATEITCKTPASATTGAKDVVVTNPGTETGTLTDGYTYVNDQYAGGTGDGWSYSQSSDLTMTGPDITISSAANQVFFVDQSATGISTITITDNSGAITLGNDLRIRIPSTFNMVWDEIYTASIGGGAASKVSTSVTYPGSKTLLLNVTENFAAGDAITISGLSFTSFTAVSSADNLELDVYNSGITYASDDKYIQIKSTDSTPFIGGTGDGWSYLESSDFKLAISKIAFTTAEQTIIQDAVSSIMTIEIQDTNSQPVTVLTDTTINLSSSSDGGSFSLNSSPWQSITSVTISVGSSSASFYYKDSNVGTPTITCAESPSVGWTDATQTVTVQTKTTQFTVSASSPQVAGSAFTLTITAKDEDGNTDTSFSATVNLTVNYVSPSSGSGTLSVTSISSWTNGVATITNETFSDCGTIAITATHADYSTKTGTSSSINFRPYDFTVVASSVDTDASGSDYARHTVAKPFTLTVTARNASGATCPNYKGTANLTINYTSPSTSQSGSLGTSSLTSTYWTNGAAALTSQTYNKRGTITITATDATLTTRTGTSSNINFIPKDFSISLSSAPASRTYYYTNEEFSATVTARDYNNTTISNYAGTVSFTGSGLTLPSNYTFTTTDSGSHTFSGINGSSETSTTLSVKDTTYTSVTGTSEAITIKEGTIKIISTSGPVGSISVQLKILDSSGDVLTEDDSTTFTVTISEFMKDNDSCTSTATSVAATVTDGIATITVKNTEAETVTVTPSSSPTLTAVAGTVRFGTVSGSGVGIQLWREIRGEEAYEKEEEW